MPYVAPEQFAASEAFLFGVDLFNHGFYWEAHESWEGLWRRCVRGQAQHQVLQGLIQIAAAYLKRALGEAAPASDLLERGCARLEQVAAQRDPFHGFAVRAFATACRGSQEQAPRLVLVDS